MRQAAGFASRLPPALLEKLELMAHSLGNFGSSFPQSVLGGKKNSPAVCNQGKRHRRNWSLQRNVNSFLSLKRRKMAYLCCVCWRRVGGVSRRPSILAMVFIKYRPVAGKTRLVGSGHYNA